MNKILIITASHKPYAMPDDPMYLPVQVGAAGKPSLGWARDDTGDHISGKNPGYCELTGLYWAWKNQKADYLGLAHYRRHFAGKRGRILTQRELEPLLERYDVILPRPRRYYIETNYSQYIHAHHRQDLELTRQILGQRHPAYLAAYDAIMERTWGHRFNMFVMKRDLAEQYCGWLFGILFELERRLDCSGYSQYDARVFGFVGERLLDVWLEANHLPYRELPCLFLERQNWPGKILKFIIRKLRGNRHG